jgi:hypothetical protein
MKSFSQTSRGITVATLLCFAAPQAEAIEVYGAGPPSRSWTTVCSCRLAEEAATREAATRATAAACIAAATSRTTETSTSQIVRPAGMSIAM